MDKYSSELGVVTQSLIATHSIEHVGSKARYLNVVRDVINVVPVVWIADNIVRPRLTSRTVTAMFSCHIGRSDFR